MYLRKDDVTTSTCIVTIVDRCSYSFFFFVVNIIIKNHKKEVI